MRDLRAKRLRYRYLAIPAMVVRSGRRFTLRLHIGYPYLAQFAAALNRLEVLRAPPA